MSGARSVRRARRTAAALVICVVSSLTVAVVAAGPAAAADIAPRNLTITVTGIGPENRTCTVDADLYVPAGVSATTRAPAVLATNGFGGTKADQADFAQSLGELGYVTLSYTGLGFVDGNLCPITLDDREHDGAAASQLLRFLGGDPSIKAVDDATGAPVRVDFVIMDDAARSTRGSACSAAPTVARSSSPPPGTRRCRVSRADSAGVRRDVPLAQGPGHRRQVDVAVLGAQRLHAGAR